MVHVEPAVSADEEEVRAANQSFYRAFESLDLARMDAAWSHEGMVTCIHPGWPLASGWSAVRHTWRLIFDNTADIRFRVDDERVDVHGDLAWVVCTERLVSRAAAGHDEGAVLCTNVFRREAGSWKVAHHHASPFLAAPQASAPPSSGSRRGLVH